MGSRLVRRTAIGCGVAALVGGGVGFAVGEPVTPEDIQPARALPKDLCARIGDVASLLPKASGGGPVTMTQGGTTAITCTAGSSRAKVRAYTSANVKVTVTAYGGRDAGAGNPPFTPEQMAKRTFSRSPIKAVDQDRPYPTKVSRTESGLAGESWTVHALVQRADVVVLVNYTANPIGADSAQQAALALADRAIWESK
ncbi:hypothetical protein [Kribbella shirazensis]|uniref:DUF3558 domain-containing protein n=1 Tax=Kribbella shirazensis TaxID=1105143 RepID=A0A7X5ZZK9_9ACTN|nr:hypothetical protein [Kribbella shirazensis]NIK55189.1 hypothetical protein [Kribbella shirazensis]